MSESNEKWVEIADRVIRGVRINKLVEQDPNARGKQGWSELRETPQEGELGWALASLNEQLAEVQAAAKNAPAEMELDLSTGQWTGGGIEKEEIERLKAIISEVQSRIQEND